MAGRRKDNPSRGTSERVEDRVAVLPCGLLSAIPPCPLSLRQTQVEVEAERRGVLLCRGMGLRYLRAEVVLQGTGLKRRGRRGLD